MPKHRAAQRPWWRRAPEVRPRLSDFVKLVDVGTRLTHLLTGDAYAEGLRPKGRYWALCGADVLPAALVDPGSGQLLPRLSRRRCGGPPRQPHRHPGCSARRHK